jgi:hypothetical protein
MLNMLVWTTPCFFIDSKSLVIPSLVILPPIQCHHACTFVEIGGDWKSDLFKEVWALIDTLKKQNISKLIKAHLTPNPSP